ncbi:MAG: glycerol-3-phosphate dehydrogenase/oxidase [Balneolaceae bacterium]
MDRNAIITSLLRDPDKEKIIWDIVIIGGGATGLGCAVDAASRGFKALLLEQHDFAKGTSSRSTKLVHGGVRYLRQGNISLVLEALKERGLLIQNAPHLVTNQTFVVPNYHWWEKPYYGIGLKMYDWLAGKRGFGNSRWLSRKQTLKHLPTLEPRNLKGGVLYHDGQFDDSRLAINLMQTVFDHGGTALNYTRVSGFIHEGERVSGVKAEDQETGEKFDVKAKVIINATGVFTDSVRRMNNPDTEPIIQVSQGVHIMLDKKFHPGKSAIMIPKTEDGRVLFAVPWHNKVLIGTTDTPVPNASLEPRATEKEIEFLLSHCAKYLAHDPVASDVKSIFTGLRPLVVEEKGKKSTKSISRDHTLIVDPSGLVTITGGKWTTYRKMGQETIDQAIKIGNLSERKSITENLNIHGWTSDPNEEDPYRMYGSDAESIKKLSGGKNGSARFHPDLACGAGEVRWAVRNEMARTVEDVLSRRTRSILLNARESMEIAPRVARIMAEELGYSKTWQIHQVNEYQKLAQGYLLDESWNSFHSPESDNSN